jgi:hypothetical protein
MNAIGNNASGIISMHRAAILKLVKTRMKMYSFEKAE